MIGMVSVLMHRVTFSCSTFLPDFELWISDLAETFHHRRRSAKISRLPGCTLALPGLSISPRRDTGGKRVSLIYGIVERFVRHCMSEILVIGHRNPDTDAICSAVG